MERLKLVDIVVVTPRHTLCSHNELGQEGHVKANENDATGNFSPEFIVHFTKHFWPPVVNSGKKRHYHTAHHYIMEVGNNVVGIMQVNIYNKRAEHYAGKPADGKQKEKHHGIKHGRFHIDGALVHGSQPVKYFNTRWDSNKEREEREYHTCKRGLTRCKHMVPPDKESDKCNSQRRKCDSPVAKYRFP